jgi:hypothetical protein
MTKPSKKLRAITRKADLCFVMGQRESSTLNIEAVAAPKRLELYYIMVARVTLLARLTAVRIRIMTGYT